MSWFLVHKQGLSLVDAEGKEEKFHGDGAIDVTQMLKDAGNLVINMQAERPPRRPIAMPQKPPGTSAAPKPEVTWHKSPNFSARGSAIKRIILHYTTAPEVAGTLDWFSRPSSRVSAHYVVDRNGDIYQCVSDERKAWHAGNENDDSIGIEHVAAKGQKLTNEQTEASSALIRYLKSQYKITNANITAHRFTASNAEHTDCPGDLWKTEPDLKEWLKVHAPDSVVSAPAKDRVVQVGRSLVYSNGQWRGLACIVVRIGNDTFKCVSGLAGAQVFRKMGEGIPGSGEPVEQGAYKPSDIIWKGGKDNYDDLWSEGLGAWVIDLFPQAPTRRSAIEFHCDLNRSSSPGTMGCIGVAEEDQKRFIAAWRAVDPTSVVVDWGL